MSGERIYLLFIVERRSQIYILGVLSMNEGTVLLLRLLITCCIILTLNSFDFFAHSAFVAIIFYIATDLSL